MVEKAHQRNELKKQEITFEYKVRIVVKCPEGVTEEDAEEHADNFMLLVQKAKFRMANAWAENSMVSVEEFEPL